MSDAPKETPTSVVGFDLRRDPKLEFVKGWNAERRRQHLAAPDVQQVASADASAWPSLLPPWDQRDPNLKVNEALGFQGLVNDLAWLVTSEIVYRSGKGGQVIGRGNSIRSRSPRQCKNRIASHLRRRAILVPLQDPVGVVTPLELVKRLSKFIEISESLHP